MIEYLTEMRQIPYYGIIVFAGGYMLLGWIGAVMAIHLRRAQRHYKQCPTAPPPIKSLWRIES